MGKKLGKAALSLTLLGAGAIAFFGLGGTDYIKSAYGSKGESIPKENNDDTTKEPPIIIIPPDLIPKENDKETIVVYQNESSPNKFDSRQEKIIEIEDRVRPLQEKIIKQKLDSRKSTTTKVNIRKPEFILRKERDNSIKYNKRKYGTDDKLLNSALSKSPKNRTINERKQIENEKAKLVFDSSRINNF